MFIEIKDLDISEDKFTRNGLPIIRQQEKLYVNLYRAVIHRHFDIQKHTELIEIGNDISEYTRFHLLPLLLDSGVDNEEAISFLKIDKENIKRALKYSNTDNMWYTSNIHMGALAAVRAMKQSNLRSLAFKLIEDLDERMFTSTKWKYKGSINRIAAFYHYVPFIDTNNIQISKRTKDVLLEDLRGLQNSLGSFCSPNGFSCIELDSVVVAAYLKKGGLDTEDLLKNKLFNHLSNFDGGWPLYGMPSGYLSGIKDIFSSTMFFQDKLWNLKKLLLDVHKQQYDNGHSELVSKAHDQTLMSNYFGLVTYMQLVHALEIPERNNLKIFNSYGLSYVVQQNSLRK